MWATTFAARHLHPHRITFTEIVPTLISESLPNPFKKVKYWPVEGGRERGGRSGSENDQEGREVDIEGGEAGQRNSPAEVEMESGRNREGDWNGVGVDLIV